MSWCHSRMVVSKLGQYGLLFSAGLLSMLAYAPFNRSIFILVALLVLLWSTLNLAAKSSNKQLIFTALSFGFGLYLGQLYWIFYALFMVIGTNLIVAIMAQLVFSLTMALFVLFSLLLFNWLRSAVAEFNYLFLFPSCWVLGEWLRGWVLTGFPWCDIAYTQVNNPMLQGFFALGGSYAVSWLMLSISGFLLVVLQQRQLILNGTMTKLQRWMVLYFIALALTGFYLHQRSYTQSYGKALKVALIQENINETEKWDSAKFLTDLKVYAQTIAKLKADIIFLPETAFPVFEQSLPEHYAADISAFAQANGAQIIVGMPKVFNAAGDYASAAVVLTQAGHPFYAKSHLVPFGEYIPFKTLWGRFYNWLNLPLVGFSAGATTQKPLVVAQQKIAFNICYENGFASQLLASAQQATLMANISDLVWFGHSIAKDQHLQLSQARALENQRYFIQGTNTGVTAIIDPWGQVQSQLPSFSRQVLSDYVQGRIGVTPYQRYGNYPIISFSLMLVLSALVWRRCRRKAK